MGAVMEPMAYTSLGDSNNQHSCSFADGAMHTSNLSVAGRDLAAAIPALLPPSAPPLERLSISWHCWQPDLCCSGCVALASLAELEVAFNNRGWSRTAHPRYSSMRRLVQDVRQSAAGLALVKTPVRDRLGVRISE